MANYSLIISPLAHQDLEKIIQYGTLNWGRDQALKYLTRFQAGLLRLHSSPKIGILRDDILEGLYVLPVEKHYILYQVLESKVEIIRILHARLDPQRA
ncbi:type II toxin-antitoxin system RelE/ParE family toxin [Thalassomonas sp. RHCl1]|uniref:type II toxin-antitoxin system RelE/ParE family toxin n=1 Tax=Thalassomonas sp. RHCl1 TaxID=2995320 RepID=UPI00248BFEF8|nr:type II toxin-antitoxin system RelE/ParE family toxin [Thalassomonas sp. RHCl1]